MRQCSVIPVAAKLRAGIHSNIRFFREWIPARLLKQASGMTESLQMAHLVMGSELRYAAPE
jgi:hypothetical protein